MPLPNNDPSLPSNPAPIFNDTEAVRGDQLRSAMQLIWGNLQYLFDFTGRTTDTLTEGLTNLYFTAARAVGSALTGFVSGADSAISAADTILQAFAKTQGQINAAKSRIAALEAVPEIVVSDTKTAGTAGGAATAGAWTNHALTTKDIDTANIATLSSDQITLPAGTYEVIGWAVSYASNNFKLRLRKTSGTPANVSGVAGTNGFVQASEGIQVPAMILGRFTISSTETFALQYWITTNGGGPETLGKESGSLDGMPDVYAQLKFKKTA